MTRKITFFEQWSWFKFNNLGLALDTNLKFCTSGEKGLKLKVRKFWGPNPMFVEVTGEKLAGGPFCPPPSWIGLSKTKWIKLNHGTMVKTIYIHYIKPLKYVWLALILATEILFYFYMHCYKSFWTYRFKFISNRNIASSISIDGSFINFFWFSYYWTVDYSSNEKCFLVFLSWLINFAWIKEIFFRAYSRK